MPQYYHVGYCFNGAGWIDYGELYADGRDAGQRLKELQARHTVAQGYRWSVKKFRDDGLPEDWQEREQARFDNGTYVPVPWASNEWAEKAKDHFAHLSLDDPGKIAYTEDAAKGECDRQTRIAPGRYLKKHFGDVLSAAEIEAFSAEVSVLTNACALKITQDAEEIETVYVNGPRSCMSEDADCYSGGWHPSRVYAGPDLAVAYVGEMSDASGRCVVWPEKKLHSTIYGDCVRFRMLLEAAGFKRGSIAGARVRKIPAGRCGVYVLPYVDDVGSAEVSGEFIVLGSGSLSTNETSGISAGGAACDQCGERYDDDDLHYVEEAAASYCDDCVSSLTTYCQLSEDRFLDDEHDFVSVATVQRRLTGTIGDRSFVFVPTYITARSDHDDVVYVEERDEHWTEEARDLCLAIEAFARSTMQPELPLAA